GRFVVVVAVVVRGVVVGVVVDGDAVGILARGIVGARFAAREREQDGTAQGERRRADAHGHALSSSMSETGLSAIECSVTPIASAMVASRSVLNRSTSIV